MVNHKFCVLHKVRLSDIYMCGMWNTWGIHEECGIPGVCAECGIPGACRGSACPPHNDSALPLTLPALAPYPD